jgi:hypothetical protein
MTPIEQFELHAARAFFASAWADACEESEQSGLIAGAEIFDVMPVELDPAAVHAARTLRMGIEAANMATIPALMTYIIEQDDQGDRPRTLQYFGHYAAMQAMGHGVGLHDAFGQWVYDHVRVPYCEFGSHSLSRDYF